LGCIHGLRKGRGFFEKWGKQDIEEEREDSTSILGKIGNLAEETALEEENETSPGQRNPP
jgi:hypothetical protein